MKVQKKSTMPIQGKPIQEKVGLSVQVAIRSIVLYFYLFKLSTQNDTYSSALYWGGLVLGWTDERSCIVDGLAQRQPFISNSTSIKADEVNAVHTENLEAGTQMNRSKNLNSSKN